MRERVKDKKVTGKRALRCLKANLLCNKNLFHFICYFGIIIFFSSNLFSQKLAILTPKKSSHSKQFTEQFETSFSKVLDIVDLTLAENILHVKNLANPYNLTIEEARNLGISIGCNFFIIIKTDNLRRSSFERLEYYESYATFYLVSSKTGRLLFWKHLAFEENNPKEAKTKLFSSVEKVTKELSDKVKRFSKMELNETDEEVAEFPDADSPKAKGLRPPLPYKRIKPKYTDLAALYEIIATVDVLVDIGKNGEVKRTEIVRWAGFGLDESVIEIVKKMNWRAADRDGKALAMRVLLRYNFKNIESNE